VILFYAAAAFLAGVALAALGGAGTWPLVMLGGAGLALGTLLAGRRREAAALGLVLFLMLFGIDRYDEARPPDQPEGVALLNDRGEVTLRGVIIDEPAEGDRTQQFTLQVEAANAGGGFQDADGRVLVVARPFPAFEYGDRLKLTGSLETPPRFEDFDYREYLARRGVASQLLFPMDVEVISKGHGSDLTRLLIDTRDALGEALKRALPEPESSLARGILLGQRAAIPDHVTDEMNRAGISHLVAISGQNVAIVAGVLVASLAWCIGRRPATALAIVLIWIYAVFVGGSPSVLRAACMATVMLGAVLAGRPGSAVGSVVLAAAVLVFWRPLIVDDVAFQLSFAATVGIVVAAKRLEEVVRPMLTRLPAGLAGFLAENFAITTAASLAVLPVIAASFGRISLVSLPANLLAAPAFVLALAGAAVAAAAETLDAGLGRLAGEFAYLPLAYLIWLGDFASGLPLASLEVRGVGPLETVALFVPVVLLLGVLRRLPASEEAPHVVGRVRPALAASALVLLLAVVVWYGALQPGPDRLRVTVLDVGQGDAILIETPAGQRILVDGGPSGARIAQALGRTLPASERRIDLVVLTHAQDDHMSGLVEVLQRYDVGAALAGPLEGHTDAYRAWRDELARSGVPLNEPHAGQRIDLGGGARIEVLSPALQPLLGTEDDLNNNSVVLRLVYGHASFLLTGDLAAEGEAALLDTSFDLSATVLKVGHHGSDGATTAPFLEAVNPSLAVISVGEENSFGHPSPTTRLRLAGVPLLRTDENGNVRLETNGTSLWVDFERGDYSRVALGAAR
jgi:competence protein ComEC